MIESAKGLIPFVQPIYVVSHLDQLQFTQAKNVQPTQSFGHLLALGVRTFFCVIPYTINQTIDYASSVLPAERAKLIPVACHEAVFPCS